MQSFRCFCLLVHLYMQLGSEGVDFTDQNSDTLLHLASLKGQDEVFLVLLAAGASLHAVGTHGLRPLHMAAVKGHASTVQLLLDTKCALVSKCALIAHVEQGQIGCFVFYEDLAS